MILVGRRADIREIELEVQDTDGDERRDEGGDHLSEEGDTRGNVRVVGELEILSERDGVRGRDVAVRLEEVHGERVALEPGSTDELGQDVERDLGVGRGVDDTDRHAEDERKEDTVEHDSGGRVRRPSTNTSSTKTDRDHEYGEVPPLRNLLVDGHEARVDVGVRLKTTLAADERLEALDDLGTVVQDGVRDGRGVDGEEEAVQERVGRGQVGRRVLESSVSIYEAIINRQGLTFSYACWSKRPSSLTMSETL